MKKVENKKMVKKKKTSIDDICRVVNKFVEDNGPENVLFMGSFMLFDKKFNVVDDRIIGFGTKGQFKITMDEFKGQMKEFKDDDELICW